MPGEAFWQTGTSAGGTGTASDGAELETVDAVIDAIAPYGLYVNGVQAVYDPVSDRTFMAWLGASRDLYAGYVDHTTGDVATPVLVASATTATNDVHGAPSIVVLTDGTLLIAWGTDSFGGPIQLARSISPRSIAAWSTSSLVGDAVYPTLIVTPNGDVLLFYLDDTALARYVMRRSTDGGATFAAASTIVDTTGVNANPIAYVFGITLAADDLVHLSWTVGNSSSGARNNVYHATFDPATDTCATIDGTSLGASVTSGDHASCLAYTGNNVWAIKHTILDDGRVFIVFPAGTDGTSPEGTYTVQVTRWDGTAWSNADTGASTPNRFSHHQVVPYKDGLLGLFAERTGTLTDVTAWISADGATWYSAGVVLAGDTGEGYLSVLIPDGDGPFLAMAEQIGAGWPTDPADAMTPVDAIVRPASTTDHTHDYEPAGTVDTHNADAAAHAGLVQAAGRWEVVVSGTPAAAVTTADTTDWLYTWVED